MVKKYSLWLALLLFFAGFSSAYAGDKVLYHIDDAKEQATRALRNIRNHLDSAPDTKIIVVTHGDGVDFLLDGARDEKNNLSYGPLIADLKSRGVTFEVCEITMKRRSLTKDMFVLEADFVPSGVVRVGHLQYEEHFAYIKP
jgi:uncharacterized protein